MCFLSFAQEHREFFAPWVHMIFPADSKIGKYMHNDWLIISWGFLAVALLFDVCLLILMIYWCGRYDVEHSNVGEVGHEIYNFATGYVHVQ